MRGKTVTVRFDGQREVRAGSVTQYDYGQVLVFQDITLPSTFEVYFGASSNGQAQKMIGHDNEVLVPDTIVESPGVKYAWVFLHEGADDGETEYIVMFNVGPRGEDSGTEPTPVQQDIITETIAALNAGVEEVEGIAEAIPETVAAALTEAKESGEFDGEDGFSPTVEVTEIEGGHEVAITDKDGTHTFDVMDGEGGGSAVSPTANVVKTGDTAVITITDKDGTTTASISDGKDGTDGDDGFSPTASVSKSGNTATISITDKSGTTTATVSDGTNGQDGDDGYSPSASVSKAGDTATITITDKIGTTSVTVKDGTDGDDGYSPTASVTKSGDTATITITDKNGTTTATVSDGQNGNDGTDGVTFTPSVSSAGVISWTNDGGRTNPESVNIKGPQGPSGEAVEETVSGTTPSITAVANHRYVCGQVSTLSFTPSATGICDVMFESGSTATVLTVPSSVKWPDWFDPANLEANAVYEINVLNGVYGAVGVWM